jgi:pullulanase
MKISILLLSLFISLNLMCAENSKNKPFLWLEENSSLSLLNQSVDDPYLLKFEDYRGRAYKVIRWQKSGDKLNLTLNPIPKLHANPHLKIKGKKLYAYPKWKYINRYYNPAGEKLGVEFNGTEVLVRLWSPSATQVAIELYDHKQSIGRTFLRWAGDGIWEKRLDPSQFGRPTLDGIGYSYIVRALGKTEYALDPYAKSMMGFNPKQDKVGRGVLVDLKNPSSYSPIKNLANPLDFVGAEYHVRDASISPTSGVAPHLRGSYLGFGEMASKIKEIGITHVQLHPLQNFYTVDERDRSFQGDKIPSDQINYNWGYDPQNYFTPEGWFSSNADDPYARINEVKKMVDSYHKNGLGLILDVVYNHLYDAASLENAAPGCYLRRHDNGEVSLTSGAGVSLESRNLATRKLIIDSILHWKDFYNFDGMRFDLMGFLDRETMVEIRKAVGSEFILYGEAWEFSDLPRSEATTKSQLPAAANLSAFNDSSRDSYTGAMSSRGFVQGLKYEIPKVRAGLIGSYKNYPHRGVISTDPYHLFAKSPAETMNFLTIHDGFTLWDKINLSFDGTKEQRLALVKMAMAMLLTGQGKVIFHGGVEMARTKPLAENDPNPDRAHTSKLVNPENGVSHFHENTYASPDTTNAINWDREQDFSELKEYLQGLIKLRRSVPAFRFADGKSIERGVKFYSAGSTSPSITASTKGPFKSFNDPGLDKLTITFINAPDEIKGKAGYLAGELHPASSERSKNPKKNSFTLSFDKKGTAEITLTEKQIRALDLAAWSDPDNLQFKVVIKAGEWDYPTDSYTQMGNNTVTPSSISKDKKVIIDLAIVNHRAGERQVNAVPWVAYSLDNTLESEVHSDHTQLKVSTLFVIHNAQDKVLTVPLPQEGQWHVYADGVKAGTRPVVSTKVRIIKNLVHVPAKTSAVLAY